jgi:hypothetical protein
MKLVETTVTATSVRMRFADDMDPAKATIWIDFQVPLSELRHPTNEQKSLGDPELQFLAEVRLAALRFVRGTIAGETQRLAELHSRTRL